MTTELLKKLGTVPADNLIAGTDPALRVGTGKLRKNTGSLKRGTVLAKSSKDGTLVVLGTAASSSDNVVEVLEPYGILTDDITVPTDEDVNMTIYIGGKFNSNKIIMASGYSMSEADKDTLRKYGIEFTAAASN